VHFIPGNPQRYIRLAAALFLAAYALSSDSSSEKYPPGQNWTNYVRIVAYPLERADPEKIVSDAQRDNVFGIEADNDIPGRYESFVDPTAKLAEIRAVAEKAHAVRNRAFVYIAGTECITANADKVAHSMAKDHPDWLQRDLSGKPAVFGGGSAFWIKPGDEDVWVTPLAPEWRKVYMERVRQIAATGIDGIYVDIPYWMTHFEGWENSWASFDDFTVQTFKNETGLDAKKDIKLGDFSDPNFRKWVDFRIHVLTDFMADIAKNAKSVNPKIMVIPEIYPGIEEEAVRVGADVYQMYDVVDAIAHEYEFGEGEHMASSRSQLDWFKYMVGWSSFRSFAGSKATWMLNYSWDGDKNIQPSEAMKNLFAAELTAGVNVWDAAGHVMSGSNDIATRRQVYSWIASHERTFYAPRVAMHPIGVYFSPTTRNYFTRDFLASYQGIIILLLQHHMEYEVVTPRTVAQFHGETLVLPDVRVLSPEEKAALAAYVAHQGKLVVTGENATGLAANQNVAIMRACPGKAHMAAIASNMTASDRSTEDAFFSSIHAQPAVEVFAPPLVATQIASVEGKPHIFFANFSGLVPGKNARQTPIGDIKIRLIGTTSTRLTFLPFLGQPQIIEGKRTGGATVFVLPSLEKGAVAWIDPVK
jgi:hypothetical protein